MKKRKLLVFELILFVSCTVYVADRAPDISIALVLMLFSCGVIVLYLLDSLSKKTFPEDLECLYDYKTAFEDQVKELESADIDVKERINIVDFKNYKRGEHERNQD